ncbi:hypothetical protein [Nonomuraea sp. B19D2]|uniref:hypothetical protein n=1 Tax=Nonomuraea sp. B19D2 TaxID=3159561 RepID=UPI0032DAA51A
MTLASLGLTAGQERLYRYLLRQLRADLDRAAADVHMPEAHAVLAELVALGLVDGTLTAVPPAAAVDLLAIARRGWWPNDRRCGVDDR